MSSFAEHPFETKPATLRQRLVYYTHPLDERYEDLKKGHLALNIFRDLMAGLIVAMVAIPLAMGFAIASGLRPEQGIVGGAIAAVIGALFGGSKYQVYGPTAAFIPVVAVMVHEYGVPFMILASMCAGAILIVMGLLRLGSLVRLVPDSIVVGFTIGIACVIVTTQLGNVLDINVSFIGHSFFEKLGIVWEHASEINAYAITLALGTFALSKLLFHVSVFIPGPLIAIFIGTVLSWTVWAGKGIVSLKDEYGSLPTDFWVFTPPASLQFDLHFLYSLAYAVIAIAFVGAVESLLSSRMADRLADKKGTPFNPNKELWGQGWVNVIIPMLNGFPHTGALARTATNIKVGALSPLAGISKCVLKLGLVAYLATYLEHMPMACIGGIMLYVAYNMVKPAEVKLVLAQSRLEAAIMVYTAIMVLVTNFVTGVGTALMIYAVASRLPQLASNEVPSPARDATVQHRKAA
jgi:MFS superfamily sulfate permease-like transporter